MTASVQYPMLTRPNYNKWALLMRVNLQAQGLWHVVEPEEGETIEYHEDRLAFATILRSMPLVMLASLSTKRNVQSAWEGIKSRQVGVQRVRESNIMQLRKELSKISFKNGESVDNFLMRIMMLANSITTLVGNISETEIVKKMLQVAPDHLKTLLDVKS